MELLNVFKQTHLGLNQNVPLPREGALIVLFSFVSKRLRLNNG